MMVVDFARLTGHAILPAAYAVSTLGQPVQHPIRYVDVVYVLLADVVSAEPVEVIPVMHLKLHFCGIRLAAAIPDASSVPVNLTADNFSRKPLPDAGHCLAIFSVIASLQANHDLEFLLIGHLGSLQTKPCAKAIDAHWLLHKHVLAGFDGRVEMKRTKTRRSSQDNKVAVFQYLLPTVEPLKLPIFRTVDLVLHRLDCPERTLDTVTKSVGHGRQFHIGSGHRERLLESACAASTTPDDANANHIAGRRLAVHRRNRSQSTTQNSSGPQGIPTRNRGLRIVHAHRVRCVGRVHLVHSKGLLIKIKTILK